MSEIYSEIPFRMAREFHRSQLKRSQMVWMLHAANAQTPHFSDYVALRLGNWLIKLGNGLKSHSAFSQLANTRA